MHYWFADDTYFWDKLMIDIGGESIIIFINFFYRHEYLYNCQVI